MSYDVSIVPCGDYSQENVRRALGEAIEAVGGLDWVQRGMCIAVKANLVTLMRPDQAATTHPTPVAELCRMLTERGARVIVGDSPGGPWNGANLKSVYAASGMKAAESAGAELNYDFSQRDAEFPEAVKAKSFPYTSWLDSADAVIDFCKLKTHGLTAMSCAVKNFFGVIPGTKKPEFHYRYPKIGDFSDMLIDLTEYVRPRLTLVDAVLCMEGNGPTQGKPRHMGAIIAAATPYSADLLCTGLIGLDGKVSTVNAAIRRGLCPENIEDMSIYGQWRDFVIDDFDTLPPRDNITFGSHTVLVRQILERSFRAVPDVEKGKCVRCGKCREVCPMQAITIGEKQAEIDRKKCIRCFCCQEFCPVGAMKVRRTLLARLLTK